MRYVEKVQMWEAIFAIGKGLTYILAMIALVKYIFWM
jgi:hypothetical protein